MRSKLNKNSINNHMQSEGQVAPPNSYQPISPLAVYIDPALLDITESDFLNSVCESTPKTVDESPQLEETWVEALEIAQPVQRVRDDELPQPREPHSATQKIDPSIQRAKDDARPRLRRRTRYKEGDLIGGRFLVHQALMGGMGEVYLGYDSVHQMPLALKTFQARYLQNPKLHSYLKSEVYNWVGLEKHPNIVRCFFLDILDNQPFIFVEWVVGEAGRGTDLRSWLRRDGPLDLRLALDFTIDICRGLIHANQKRPGIVHRDLKPDNILISQGRIAKITDFGLAQIAEKAQLTITDSDVPPSGQRQGLTRVVAGTPPYMSPEQWRTGALDVRADIYALGCVLYEMLTSKFPFSPPVGQTHMILAWQRAHEQTPLPTLPEPMPTSVSTIIQTCLAKEPVNRFATVDKLLQELSRVYEQQFDEQPRAVPISNQFTAIDYVNRGATYTNLQLNGEALIEFNRAIQLDPTLALAYLNRGNSYAGLRYYQEAIADFNRAIQLDPTMAQSYSNRGNTYANLGRYEEALIDFSRALDLNPANAQVYVNRGVVYEALQRYQEARMDYTHAIDLDPTLAQAYANRAVIYDRLGRYDEALADFNRAIQLNPTDALVYANRGAVYDRLQRYEDALANYTQAIELEANDGLTREGERHQTVAYTNRALTLAKLGRYEEAEADFHRVLKLDYKATPAYLNLGILYAMRGELHKGLPYFEEAAQLGDPEAAHYAAQTRRMLNLQLS